MSSLDISLDFEQKAIYIKAVQEVGQAVQKLKNDVDRSLQYLDDAVVDIGKVVQSLESNTAQMSDIEKRIIHEMKTVYEKTIEEREKMNKLAKTLDGFTFEYNTMIKNINNASQKELEKTLGTIREHTAQMKQSIINETQKSIQANIEAIEGFVEKLKEKLNMAFFLFFVAYIVGLGVVAWTSWKAYKEYKVINYVYQEILNQERR